MDTSISAPPLEPGCPWSDWTPPNVHWCEENLCSIVTTPANTWSNLAFLLVGLWMWREARCHERSDLAWYGPAVIVVGIFSFAYHASYTFFFQFFDFVGMFVFLDLVIVVSLQRLGRLSGRSLGGPWLGLVVGSSALVPILFLQGVPIQILVVLTILYWLACELAVLRKTLCPGTLLWLSVVLAGLAALGSAADITGLYCNPQDHVLQGHAAWHLLTACSFYALFRHHLRLGPPEPR